MARFPGRHRGAARWWARIALAGALVGLGAWALLSGYSMLSALLMGAGILIAVEEPPAP